VSKVRFLVLIIFFVTLSDCAYRASDLPVAHLLAVNLRLRDHRPATCPSSGKVLPLTSPKIAVPSNLVSFNNLTVDGNDWKLTAKRSSDPLLDKNPQELCGVEGMSVDRAWNFTLGSTGVTIAVIDSGIEWCEPGIVNKIAINTAALPPPENQNGQTKNELELQGIRFSDRNPYNLNNSDVINVDQWTSDPRVERVATLYGGYFCQNQNTYSYHGISPEDLIRTFADPTLPGNEINPYYVHNEGPRGFYDAIAGWNFVDNNDDPYDSVHYDHGTGEALDSAGQANVEGSEIGTCPKCMILPIRVSDSFIATGNLFAEALAFGVDSGASVIQEALGTLDYTEADQQAINYAYSYGVPVVASAADEESFHQNLPAFLDHMIVVNSITKDASYNPPSYLYVNGCTNFGANILVSVESTSCSSEATGKAAGIVGLLESLADTLVLEHKIKPYPGLHNIFGAPVGLSVNQVKQLLSMTADDIDFQTPVKGIAPKDNYRVYSPSIPLATTSRYPTAPGFDPYTGYGRINAARLLGFLNSDMIPPVAEINSPSWFGYYQPNEDLIINATMGDPYNGAFSYQVDIAYGIDPKNNDWHLVAQGNANGLVSHKIVSLNLSAVKKLFPGQNTSGGPTHADGSGNDNRFTFTILVTVKDANGLVGYARRAEFLHSQQDLLNGFPLKFKSSIVAPIKYAPIGPDHTNVLLVVTSDGFVHAITSDRKELPGWPVHTNALPYHQNERAYSSGAINASIYGEIIGGIAVGDLNNDKGSSLDIVAADTNGYIYAWNQSGKLLPGWPQKTDPHFSGPGVENPDNRVLSGIASAPVLTSLDNNSELDVIVAAMDRHLYAFSPNGKILPGFPVLVADPNYVTGVDPVSNQVTFNASVDVLQGTKMIDTPAIAVDPASGEKIIIVGTNEQYKTPVNANLKTVGQLLNLASYSSKIVNSELYAIWPDGTDHPGPNRGELSYANAFLPGWPVNIADIYASLLPDIGDGISQSPTVYYQSGQPVILAQATAGPVYELNLSGQSIIGNQGGVSVLMPQPDIANLFTKNGGNKILDSAIPALGSPVPFKLSNGNFAVVTPAVSLGRLLDSAYPADQSPNNNYLDILYQNGQTSSLTQLNDLPFFIQPIVADLSNSKNPYVVSGSGLYDLRAVNIKGNALARFPQFDGGWVVFGPGFSSFGTLPVQVLSVGTRSGYLFAFQSTSRACRDSGPWPEAHHDLYNTDNLNTPDPIPISDCS
jgi:hypothetical protein